MPVEAPIPVGPWPDATSKENHMSIDRCNEAKRIIESALTGGYECITQEDPEQDGVYAVSVRAASPERAGELRHAVHTAFSVKDIYCQTETSSYWDGQGGVNRGALVFRINVGDIRSL